MIHNHNHHNHTCKHPNVEYCSGCGKVFCKTCGKEWGNGSGGGGGIPMPQPWRPVPWTPTRPTFICKH